MPNKRKKGRGKGKKQSQEQATAQAFQTPDDDYPPLGQSTGQFSHEVSHIVRPQSVTTRPPDREERGRSRNDSQEQAAAQELRTPDDDYPPLDQSTRRFNPEIPQQIRQQSELIRPPDREGSSSLQSTQDINRKYEPEVQEFALPRQESVRQKIQLTSKTDETPTDLLKSRDISESMCGLSLESKMPIDRKTRKMAERKPPGTLGRPIDLIANYFALQYEDIEFFHYDVDIVFQTQYRTQEKEKADVSGMSKPILVKKGKSILKEGPTAKKDKEKNVPNLEHQQKRIPGKQRCRKIITEMIKDKRLNAYKPVYDGQKNLYTTRALPMTDAETQVSKFMINLTEEIQGQTLVFEVIIKPAEQQGGGNRISLEPLREIYKGRSTEIPYEVIMAFDTVMCHREPPFTQIQVGRSFFLLGEQKYQISEGLEIWFGYNQSIHLTQRGPAVIVNYAGKAFHQDGNVIDCASKILKFDIRKQPKLSPDEIKTLTKELTEVRVEVMHQKNISYRRKYHIQGLTTASARDTYFKIDGRTKISVANFFRENYEELCYPNLPCLHMRACNNTVYMPMEVCYIIPGQPKVKNLSKNTTTEMIKKMTIRPDNRFDKIWKNAQHIQEISGPLMSQFGLSMELKFMQLQGRILNAPQLGYKPSENRPCLANVNRNGIWKMDQMEFLRSSNDTITWMIISFSDEEFCSLHNLELFANTLCTSARRSGINLEKPLDICIFLNNETTKVVLEYAKKRNVTLAVVILTKDDTFHTYDEVKFIADTQLHLMTQCMKDTVVQKFIHDHQVNTNVLLKINPKAGGINHKLYQQLNILSRPIIVFGADVTHSARGHACPSIAAVVGSLDAYLGQYATTCRVQENPDENRISQEIIIELKDMVKEIIRAFLKNTHGKKPERIIFFRDGVSEGQFSTVLEKEVNLIQYACIEELGGFLPPLTFIVVQKRHNTRFRPRKPGEGVGPGNVPPGTTVDTDVVHPVFFDFFLCSHESRQGTSRPAHYTVLHDENKLSSNELQQLCYFLCHTYLRCNKSISVPAPIMYADLACRRAKCYAKWYLKDDDGSASSSSSGKIKNLSDDVIDAITNMGSFQPGGMFYT